MTDGICLTNQEVVEYVLHTLDGERRTAADGHLPTCPRCRNRVLALAVAAEASATTTEN